MKSMEEIAKQQSEQQITEDFSYDYVIEKLQEARDNNVPIEEGILGAITGGIIGAAAGPALGKAFCKVLGIDERGQFGSLITSRLVTTALGAAIGWK